MDAGEPIGGEERFVFDPTECRVVGTLLEKALATPEAYPLTVNALVAGCNQKSNRDPQLSLEPFEIEGALTALQIRGAVNVVERLGSRTARYAHRIGERLGLETPDLAVLAELMVRGPQTVNELVTRTKRMNVSMNSEQMEARLKARAQGADALYALNPRGHGERYPRWRHLLAVAEDGAPPAAESPDLPLAAPPAPSAGPAVAAPSPAGGDLASRLATLEARVARLERAIGEGGASFPPPAESPAPSRDPAPEPTPENSDWIDLD